MGVKDLTGFCSIKKEGDDWGLAYKRLGVRKTPDYFREDEVKMVERVRKRAFNILMVRQRELVDDTDWIESGGKSPFLSDF